MALNRAKVVQEAERFVARGRIGSAIKEYRRLLAENPDDVSTLNRVGDLYVQNDQTEDAIRLFSDVAERYTRDGFHTRAIAIFKKIIRTDPTRLDAYERLAELYAHERLVNDALQQYQVLVEYYLKHANPASASKILQKMAAVQPDDPTLLLRLAELYERQKLHDKALAEYRKIAELMLRHGKAEEAHKVFARALELAPQDLSFVTDMVLGLKDAGHLGLAARLLTRAVELNPLAERIAKLAGGLGRTTQAVPVVAPPPAADPVWELAPAEPDPLPSGPAVSSPFAPPAATEWNPEPLGEEDLVIDLDLDSAAPLAGLDVIGPVPAMPAPSRQDTAPPVFSADEIEIELELDDDAHPSTWVEPPSDMLASPVRQAFEAPGPAPQAFSLDLGPDEGESFAGEVVPSADLPPDIDWNFEDAALDLDVELPEISLDASDPHLSLSTSPAMPEVGSGANGLTTVPLDTAALERSVQEIQRKPPPREAELLAEAEVFAKYELMEKALDRVREVLQMSPKHLGALALAVQLHLKEGRPERALSRAQQLARAATEAGKPEAWSSVRQKLIHAGLDLSGAEFATATHEDGLSQLVDSLVPHPPRRPSAPAAAAKPTRPAKPAKQIEAELDLLASQVLTKPVKGKPKAAPPRAVAAEAPPTASAPPVQPAIPEIPAPRAATPTPRADERLELPPAAFSSGPGFGAADHDGLGAVDEDELPGIRIPMKPATARPAPAPARQAASPDELDWLDDALAKAPAAQQADEKLFDDEEGFFDLAAELEQELSKDDLFDGGDLLPMPKEPSLEEIVEGFKKGVAESLSPEDVDTHYNLGIAYREMGLLDDAIGEFQVAAKDPRYLVECSSMLGICFLDKGLPELAVKWYRRALDSPGLNEETSLGLLYDLGNAQMAAGDKAAARETFGEVYGANANFRDIAAVLAELGADA